MALRWDLGKIADYETVCFIEAPCDDPNYGITKGDRILNPVTNALIWATIGIDLPGIPEGDAAEFFARLRFTELVDGPKLLRAAELVDGMMKRPAPQDSYITEDEVLAHVGLTVNVSKLTRTQWLKKFNHDLDDLAASFKKKEAVV